ncbi:MAG: capsular biosynthesis protein [Methylococcaceae bacterium]|nr:capsular biosynthesis protein [Methylococcaceae bacterium]
MLDRGLEQFAGRRVLLLQGPVGPFFARLAKDLNRAGAQVFKVNFNAGDWLFYPRDALNYQGTMEDWPDWFEALIARLDIDAILLFGDCRPIHRVAHAIAARHGLEIGVFEEGYVRPDYVTLERFGVNGNSQLPREPEYYKFKPPLVPPKREVGNAYWPMVWYGFCYFTIGALGWPWFRHYRHHRPLSVLEALPWVRSVWRKQWYRWTERDAQEALTTRLSRRYFLVPLQVFNDAQIKIHADFGGVEHFIETTLHSFARHAPEDTFLVFKHHPMDRGYRDYTALIARVAKAAGIGQRVHYIHDQHLPSLLDHARGVVVVNSTVGLSALLHGAATKVCGKALYDMPGLTFQGALDQFWRAAPDSKPDLALYQRFRDYLVARTQLNGSFYKPMKLAGSRAGVVWGSPQNPDLPAIDFAVKRHVDRVPVFPTDISNLLPLKHGNEMNDAATELLPRRYGGVLIKKP